MIKFNRDGLALIVLHAIQPVPTFKGYIGAKDTESVLWSNKSLDIRIIQFKHTVYYILPAFNYSLQNAYKVLN